MTVKYSDSHVVQEVIVPDTGAVGEANNFQAALESAVKKSYAAMEAYASGSNSSDASFSGGSSGEDFCLEPSNRGKALAGFHEYWGRFHEKKAVEDGWQYQIKPIVVKVPLVL